MTRARFIWFFMFLLIVAGCYLRRREPSPSATADSSPVALAFAGTLWFTEINANKIGIRVP